MYLDSLVVQEDPDLPARDMLKTMGKLGIRFTEDQLEEMVKISASDLANLIERLR